MKMDGFKITTKEQEERVTKNLGIVHTCVRKLRGKAGGLDINDAISLGYLALIKAAVDFDPSRGCKFSTLAFKYVDTYLKEQFHNMFSVIHVPRINFVLLNQMKRGWVFSETTTETLLKSVKACRPLVEVDGDGISSNTLIAPTDDREYEEDELAALKKAMDKLDDRTQIILRLKFGFDGYPKTLKQIGVVLGVSKERTRQLILSAMILLRGLLDRDSPETKLDRRKADAQARYRQRKIDSGECSTCTRKLDRLGSLCTACIERIRVAKNNNYNKCRIEMVCYCCRRELDRGGVVCSKCLEAKRLQKAARRQAS